MRLNKTQNAKRNMVYGIGNKFLNLLLPFVVRTAIINVLGAEYLGIDSLFTSILQVLNLSELGFGTAMVYSMYKPIAEDDTETICALLALYKKIYRIIGLVILAAGLFLLPFLPWLIKGTWPEEINIYLLYLIYLFNTVASYLLFAYKVSILNAFQRRDIVSTIGMIVGAVMNCIQIALLYCFHNYYIYLIVLPLCTILQNLMIACTVKKKFPQYSCRGQVPADIRKNIKIKVMGLMVSNLCGVSRNAFDSIFLSTFLGLSVTAMYANYYYVSAAVTSIMGIFSTSLLAGIGNSMEIDGAEKNYQTMYKLDFIYMLAGGWCSVCLLCLYQPFMKIWVGVNYMFSPGVVILFVVYFYALKMGDVRFLYTSAAGLWWENRNRAIIETIVNLILNFILGKLYGVYGIISATLIALLVFNFGYGSKIIFKYYFKSKKKQKEYLYNHMVYAAVTIGIGILTYGVCSLVKKGGWTELLIKAMICLMVPAVLYIAVYYRTKQYALSVPWLLEILNLKKRLRLLIPRK